MKTTAVFLTAFFLVTLACGVGMAADKAANSTIIAAQLDRAKGELIKAQAIKKEYQKRAEAWTATVVRLQDYIAGLTVQVASDGVKKGKK